MKHLKWYLIPVAASVLTACNGGSGGGSGGDTTDNTDTTDTIIRQPAPEPLTSTTQFNAYIKAFPEPSTSVAQSVQARLIIEDTNFDKIRVIDWPAELNNQGQLVNTTDIFNLLYNDPAADEVETNYESASIIANIGDTQYFGELPARMPARHRTFELALDPVFTTQPIPLPDVTSDFVPLAQLSDYRTTRDNLKYMSSGFSAEELNRLKTPILEVSYNNQVSSFRQNIYADPVQFAVNADSLSLNTIRVLDSNYLAGYLNQNDTVHLSNNQTTQLDAMPLTLDLTINQETVEPSLMVLTLPEMMTHDSGYSVSLLFSDGTNLIHYQPDLAKADEDNRVRWNITQPLEDTKYLFFVSVYQQGELISSCADSDSASGITQLSCRVALPQSNTTDNQSYQALTINTQDNLQAIQPGTEIYLNGELAAISDQQGQATIMARDLENMFYLVARAKGMQTGESLAGNEGSVTLALTEPVPEVPYSDPDYPSDILGEGRICHEIEASFTAEGSGLYRLDVDGDGPLDSFITHCSNGNTLVKNSGYAQTPMLALNMKTNTLGNQAYIEDELELNWSEEAAKGLFIRLSDAQWNAIRKQTNGMSASITDDTDPDNTHGFHSKSSTTTSLYTVDAGNPWPPYPFREWENSVSLKNNPVRRFSLYSATDDGFSFLARSSTMRNDSHKFAPEIWPEAVIYPGYYYFAQIRGYAVSFYASGR